MLKLGLLFKPGLKDKEKILKELELWKQELGYDSQEISGRGDVALISDWQEEIDFILCFGGDGTILHSVEYSIFHKAPVLGVNLGKLGFLSGTSLKDLKRSIFALINGKYKIENRMLLDLKVIRDKNIVFQGIALNDVVLFKGDYAKLVNLRLYSNRQFVYQARCDGMIISTPTGSTAYSLAAGGPIISPTLQSITVTPLNPQILTTRPMVFDKDDIIEIKLPQNHQVYLQTDGNSRCDVRFNDKVIIKKAEQTVKFVKLNQETFYNILRKKLQIGMI